jgi:hypothetical protein
MQLSIFPLDGEKAKLKVRKALVNIYELSPIGKSDKPPTFRYVCHYSLQKKEG